MTRTEAVEIAGDPDMETAHIHRQGNVFINDVLHGAHDAQRMQGELIQLMAAHRQQFTLLLAILEDFSRLRAEVQRRFNPRGEFIQR